MLFECSEEEIVRMVRRREGYSLWKSYWKNPLSKGLFIVMLVLVTLSIILSSLNLSGWSIISLGVTMAVLIMFMKRLNRTCRNDGLKLLFEYTKDKVISNVQENESLNASGKIERWIKS